MDIAKVLTIAGSDSGGAAGLQADLKTLTRLGVYGMCGITAVTAQNSHSVTAVQFLPPKFVAAQIEAVLSDYGADGIKTGFIGSVPLIEAIAEQLKSQTCPIVIDPVLVNHKGESMFETAVTEAYLTHLFPIATLITPNRHEAELLTGLAVTNLDEGETAVQQLCKLCNCSVLLKNIPNRDKIIDLLFDGSKLTAYPTERIVTENTHGSGDTLSAAICAFLARGDGLETAVSHARTYTHNAIKNAIHWQLGSGHGPLNHLEEQ